MYALFVVVHSLLRWVVVIAAVAAVGRALMGWFQGKSWAKLDDRLGLIYTSAMDTQLLVGLVLYFILSPLTQTAFQDFGAAMQTFQLRFFAVEHIVLMVLAVVVAHVARMAVKRAEGDKAKHQRAALIFGLSIVLVLLSIPWWRSAVLPSVWTTGLLLPL